MNYGKPGMASIYLELKSVFDMPIPGNADCRLPWRKSLSMLENSKRL